MAKRLSQALGVDVGTQSIKIATVRMGRDGPAVSSLGKGPTPDGTVDHTGIFDPQALGAALKGLVAMSGAPVRDAVFCIGGQSAVVVRNLEVPRMSDKELSEHMTWEIQRNIPFAETTVVSDFRAVENPELQDTQNMEVVMAVSPQSAIDMVIDLLRAAGCRACAIDVEPLGLGRVLKSCHANDLGGKKVCVVHIGHSMTAINMYRSGVLAFPRTVPIGGALLTKAIADGLGIGMAEAEETKVASAAVPEAAGASGGYATPGATVQADFAPYNPFTGDEGAGEGGEAGGVAEGAEEAAAPTPAPAPVPASSEEADRLFKAMQDQLTEFVAELRRSLDYFRSRGGDIEAIALSGGGANLKGLDAYIARSLDVPVTKLNPFQGIGVEVRGEGATYTSENASEFTVAVGMGLHIAYD